jgi:hypothetical protein
MQSPTHRGGATTAGQGPAGGAGAGGSASPAAPSLGTGYASFPTDPLLVQLVPLRRPEMSSLGPIECTEPGDMLHEACAGLPLSIAAAGDGLPPYELDHAVLLPAVTYPPKDGGGSQARYLVGEVYRATLVIQNTSSYDIQHVSVTVSCIDPKNTSKKLLEVREQTVGAFATFERRLEGYEWVVAGRHTINILAYYADPNRAGDIRNVPTSLPVTVGQGIATSEFSATPVPPYRDPLRLTAASLGALLTSDAASDSASTARDSLSTSQPIDHLNAAAQGPSALGAAEVSFEAVLAQRYRCDALLVNNTNGPLHLTEVVFRKAATTIDDVTVHDPFGVPAAIQRDGLWLPKESRRLAFEAVLTPSRSTPLAQGATGQDPSKMAAALDIGAMRWGWRRPNGDGGHGATPYFRRPAVVPLISSLAPTSDPPGSAAPSPSAGLQSHAHTMRNAPTGPSASTMLALAPPLVVIRSCIVAEDGGAGAKLGTSPPMVGMQQASLQRDSSRQPLAVGEQTTLHFVVANTSARPMELVAHVAPERLLPRFLYTGATQIPIGVVEPRRVGVIGVDVVPLLDGVLRVDASCLELRDSRRPATDAASSGQGSLVWPTASLDLRGHEPAELILAEYLGLSPTVASAYIA